MTPASPIIAFVILCLLSSGLVQAQDKNEEVTIIAPYNPSVTSAGKINRNPKVQEEAEGQLPEIQYELQSIKLKTSVAPDNPQAARVPGDPEKDLFRNHLRAGFGNYVTPYFELWVNSLQSDEFKAGAHLRHISSFGQIKDYGESSFSNSMIEAYAAKFFNGHTLGAAIGYSNRMVHRYGYMPEDFPEINVENKDIRQVYNTIGFHTGMESTNEDDDAFNYRVTLDGYHLFDRYESHETGIFFRPGISKKLDLFGNKRSQELGLDMAVDYYLNGDSLSSYSGGIFSAKPFVKFDLSPYRIYVGIKADYRADSASKLHLYPVIRAEVGLLEDIVVIYAGAEGGLDRTSYKELSDENPFVNAIIPLGYANEKMNFFGGIKGRISEIVDYQAGLRYRTIEDMPLYVNDTSTLLENTFTVIYDNIGIFSIEGQLGLRSRSDFGFIFRAGYHTYSTDREEKAWHKPGLELAMETFYVIREKFTISANLTARDGMYARSFTDGNLTAEQIDGWFDIGIGGEYRINSQFSAFLTLNNLLNNGYFKWYHYPVQKFNAMAGIGFSF